MKVGFIGNANNYPFTLAQSMRRLGVEVRFLVTSIAPLDRPEARFGADAVSYGDWAFDLAPMYSWDSVLPTPKRTRAQELLRDCDAIVANGVMIALAARQDKPLFVICSGSDLEMAANPAYLGEICNEGRGDLRSRLRSEVKRWLYRRLIPAQRAGFRKAAGLEYALPGILPHGDELLRDIGVDDSRRFAFMLTDLEKVPKTPLPDNERLRILCVARLNWCNPLPPGFSVLDNKRTDILLNGVAEFKRQSSEEFELVLPTKGLHVAETRHLVEQLGLSENTVWLPEQTQAEFMKEMQAADIIADHFGEGAIGMGARDAIALGRPVIANGKPEIHRAFLGEPLPIFQAQRPDEIAAALLELQDRALRDQLADRARGFAERHFSAEIAAKTILSLLRD